MPRSRVRLAATTAAVLTASLGAVTTASAQDPTSPEAAERCANATAAPTALSDGAYAAAIDCLVDERRAAAGLRPLTTNRLLRIAAVRHTADMIALRYFDHVGPKGDTPLSRVRTTGYTKARSWEVGEVLAWGTGERATPLGVVTGWMGSPPHRRILLTKALREMGVGLLRQAAVSGDAGVTVTAVLGHR